MIDAARLVALLGEGCSTTHGAAVGAEVVALPCAKVVWLHAVVLENRITEGTTVVAVVFAAGPELASVIVALASSGTSVGLGTWVNYSRTLVWARRGLPLGRLAPHQSADVSPTTVRARLRGGLDLRDHLLRGPVLLPARGDAAPAGHPRGVNQTKMCTHEENPHCHIIAYSPGERRRRDASP